jgi:hypothetical protein
MSVMGGGEEDEGEVDFPPLLTHREEDEGEVDFPPLLTHRNIYGPPLP